MDPTAAVQQNGEFPERIFVSVDCYDGLRAADAALAGLQGNQLIEERQGFQGPIVSFAPPQIDLRNAEGGSLEGGRHSVVLGIEAPGDPEQDLVDGIPVPIGQTPRISDAALEADTMRFAEIMDNRTHGSKQDLALV